ncbi:MAG: family 20 glycosylhydrolase [Opitutaceae bacterium]|nr:family 20 glycosylhydrolase [Opitutaceae bacterium]
MPTTPHITRAFQWDLARQAERLDFLLQWLPRYAGWGYQELYLHLEDAVEYPSLPAVARRDAYTYRQFARLVDAATAAGIRVVPIVNLLGHTQYLIKVPGLRDLNELRDGSGRPLAQGQICPLHPRTVEVAAKLLRDMAPFCTAGKVHVGLDESFHLGRCPRCRAEIRRAGLAGHFAAHVNRLHGLTAPLGLRLGLWADMLALLPAAIPQLPRTVMAYDWYYYPFARHPRVELRNFADSDLAGPLQARGIEYWGCPMNGAFRYEPLPVFGERLANIVSWWRRCQCVGAGGFLVTSWEANRLAIELTMAVDAAAACLWLDPEIEDPREMLARGFERVFGSGAMRLSLRRRSDVSGRAGPLGPPRKWARTALAADAHAFVGYHRWQINRRWDVCAERQGVERCERELRALQGIYRAESPDPAKNQGRDKFAPLPVPPALATSLAFRLYLAHRDVFVRRAAQAVFQLRRDVARLQSDGGIRRSRPATSDQRVAGRGRLTPPLWPKIGAVIASLRAEAAAFAAALRAGRTAARAMWRRSRDPQTRGPNERMLERDQQYLREWRRWLGQAQRRADIIWQATPVCGAWQLQFTVHNFAPALQKIVVEQRQLDGSWATLHSCYAIEFRAFAARPRTGITREFSVPVHAAALGRPLHVGAQAGEAGPGSTNALVGRVIPNAPRRLGDKPPYPSPAPRLRLAVRGVGQVAISRVELTNGVTTLRPAGWPPTAKKIFGRPAPHRGFPAGAMDQTGCIPLVFFAETMGARNRRR